MLERPLRGLFQRPFISGIIVGVLAGWGLTNTDCALKWRGAGDCALFLPGEDRPLGRIAWGVLAGSITAGVLLLVRSASEYTLRAPATDPEPAWVVVARKLGKLLGDRGGASTDQK